MKKLSYGYDVSGDVQDDKQLNVHDLHLLGDIDDNYSRGNCEHTTLPPDAVLYVGLTLEQFRALAGDLLLFGKPEQAMLYAQSLVNCNKQRPQQPLVMQVKFGNLQGLTLLPVPGYTQHESWQACYRDTGGFLASGDLAKIRSALHPYHVK